MVLGLGLVWGAGKVGRGADRAADAADRAADDVGRAADAANQAANDVGRAADAADQAADDVGRAADAADQAADDVGRAADAAENAARVAETEAQQFNETVANGVAAAETEAQQFNETVANGVAAAETEAQQFNETVANGVAVAETEAQQFNETVANGVAVAETEAQQFNETVNQQASAWNETAFGAAEDWERVVDSFVGTSDLIDNAIQMWMPHVDLILKVLGVTVGPVKMLMGGHYLVLILQGLQILPNSQARAFANIGRELRTINTRLRVMTEMYQTVEGLKVVENMTKSSIIYNKASGTIQSYFFYSDNNILVEQLTRQGYFAYSFVRELLEDVFSWNAFCDAAQRQGDGNWSNFKNRSTTIYFLDPDPEPKEFSKIAFSDIHKNVRIINQKSAKKHLTFNSITVRDGCSVRLEYFTVRKIDATYGGKAALYGCDVNWKKMSLYQKPSPNPFLFGGSPDKFNNPYNVCGTVFCNEETTYATPPLTKWSPGQPQWSCDDLVILSDEEESIQGVDKRTITNISDTVWYVELKGSLRPENKRMKIKPFGGKVSFCIRQEPKSSFVSRISGGLLFIDEGNRKYYHRFKGKSSLPNFTIVCPRIGGSGRVMGSVQKHDGYRQAMENETEDDDAADDKAETSPILVVGRFGSGKSTLLNALAGVHWNFTDGNFSVNTEAVERFQTSRLTKGCTTSVVAKDISTFDGRQLTVIDTVGYDDSVSSESIYNNSNLTDVMDQYKNISAIVLVVNSKDHRLTEGFVESLACLPKSFKKNIRRNIVFVFTNWTMYDEEEDGDKPCRGFTDQVNRISKALGIEGVDKTNNQDDSLPMFWLDNRKFKTYDDNARRTISNLRSFLDHVAGMPKLSCREFKEMRALSHFQSSIRKAYQKYFTPSNRNLDNPSGFEKFLYACAYRHEDSISKSTVYYTEKLWSEELFKIMQDEMVNKLPEEMQKICEEVAVGVDRSSFSLSDAGESVGAYVTKGLIFSGIVTMYVTAFINPLSLLALPTFTIIAFAHSKTWKRQDAINRVVFGISEESGKKLLANVVSEVSFHIDKMGEDLQKYFD